MPFARQYLLIGSGPRIEAWWERFGAKALQQGFRVCAINNAWAVAPEAVFQWYRSDDFRGPKFPAPEEAARMEGFGGTLPEPRFAYQGLGSGTMLLNALYDLLNRLAGEKAAGLVAVAGCDLVYPPGQAAHFYGRGTPDPLRHGKEPLIRALRRAQRLYEENGCQVVNAGDESETLLPFPRAVLIG
ncbi:MAG: hypothetical protein V1918_05535 [Planctomycetota bacterium]